MLQAGSWREGQCHCCRECERRSMLEGKRRPQVNRAFTTFISYDNRIKQVLILLVFRYIIDYLMYEIGLQVYVIMYSVLHEHPLSKHVYQAGEIIASHLVRTSSRFFTVNIIPVVSTIQLKIHLIQFLNITFKPIIHYVVEF